MRDFMQAMDEELKTAANTSRQLDGTDDDDYGIGIGDDSKVAEDAHVLTNLLQSLDASGGGPGPVQNILKEMGLEPPDVQTQDD